MGCLDRLRTYRRDETGAIAVIFALVLVPLIGIAATAVDYGRASHVKTMLQNAADAGIVAAQRHLLADDGTIKRQFASTYAANLRDQLKAVPYRLSVVADRSRIAFAVETKIATSLIAIMGFPTLDVAVTAEFDARKTPAPPPREIEAIAKGVDDAMREVRVSAPGLAGLPSLPPGIALTPEQARMLEHSLRSGELQRTIEVIRDGLARDMANAPPPSARDIEAIRRMLAR